MQGTRQSCGGNGSFTALCVGTVKAGRFELVTSQG